MPAPVFPVDRAATRLDALRVLSACVVACVVGLGLLSPATGRADGLAEAQWPLDATQRQRVLQQIDAVGRRGFLYEVQRPADAIDPSSRKLFLYGTIHLGRTGNEPFNTPVLTALRQSRRLALEADPTDTAAVQRLALDLGRYADGDGLQRHLSPALMARVRAFGDKAGLPAASVARFKPWLLANMVAVTELGGVGLDPSLGTELYLTGFARGIALPIVEIEGVEAQLRFLAAMPDALQVAQLDEALADVDAGDGAAQGKAIFDLWLDGDVAAAEAMLADLRRDAQSRIFERYFLDQLIDRRNVAMADKAIGYLERPGNTFFAVGTLHLFGETGLIREFERRGYRVVDLQPATTAPR